MTTDKKQQRIVITFRKGCCHLNHFWSEVFDPESVEAFERVAGLVLNERTRRKNDGWNIVSERIVDVKPNETHPSQVP